MTDEMEADMARGRELLEEIRREAGYNPEVDDVETLWRYIELLEASVVGQKSAQSFIARSLRPSIPPVVG